LQDPQRAAAGDALRVGHRLLLGDVHERLVRLRANRALLRR
jgi:hypothetical protein